MTVFELAVAGYARQLLKERQERPLTRAEEHFLLKVDSLAGRIQLREMHHDETAPRYSTGPRN